MSNVNIDVNLNVTPLPDNGTWFANSASWTSYWSGQSFSTTIPQASTTQYGVVITASTLTFNVPTLAPAAQYQFPVDLGGGNMQVFTVPTSVAFDSLYTAFQQLLADYTTLKTALKNAGLISAA